MLLPLAKPDIMTSWRASQLHQGTRVCRCHLASHGSTAAKRTNKKKLHQTSLQTRSKQKTDPIPIRYLKFQKHATARWECGRQRRSYKNKLQEAHFPETRDGSQRECLAVPKKVLHRFFISRAGSAHQRKKKKVPTFGSRKKNISSHRISSTPTQGQGRQRNLARHPPPRNGKSTPGNDGTPWNEIGGSTGRRSEDGLLSTTAGS